MCDWMFHPGNLQQCLVWGMCNSLDSHDDVIKWKHFPRYWPFVRGIHRSPVNSPHKGQWRVALMFSLICAWINGWVNNGEAGEFRRHCAHYDVTVMDWNGQAKAAQNTILDPDGDPEHPHHLFNQSSIVTFTISHKNPISTNVASQQTKH